MRTCRRAAAACSTLESAGAMARMQARLGEDADLAAAYRAAHESYLADRGALAERHRIEVPQLAGVSAGGMPDRVKCLHVLAAHSLAAGPGVNPLGDQVLAMLAERGLTPDGSWGGSGSCVPGPAATPAAPTGPAATPAARGGAG